MLHCYDCHLSFTTSSAIHCAARSRFARAALCIFSHSVRALARIFSVSSPARCSASAISCRDSTSALRQLSSISRAAARCSTAMRRYGIKCDIPEDEVLTDALELLPLFDNISDDEHNRFTQRDVLDAMNMYQENYVTYSRAEVERVSGISVPPNKRNGLKQNQHLYLARRRKEDMKAIDLPMKAPEGRPKGSSQQKKLVEEWQKSHPDGKKSDCIRDTGLSKPTVYRWWKVAVKTSESHVKPLENKKCTFVLSPLP